MRLGSRDSRSGRSAWPFLVALSATVVLLAGACGSPAASAPAAVAAPAKAVVPPDTPTGVQLRWLIAAMARLPLSGAQVRMPNRKESPSQTSTWDALTSNEATKLQVAGSHLGSQH